MRSMLDEFTKELDDLAALLESIKPVNDALATHPDQLVRRYVLVRRQFDYAAFAVALYASFEKFVEDLIAAYAQLESRRLHYVNCRRSFETSTSRGRPRCCPVGASERVAMSG